MKGQIPCLRPTPTGQRHLYVHGKPYLMLAAELQNSSLSSPEYMRKVWPTLLKSNINTVLGCVPWEQIEPREDQFDFIRLDQVIEDARQNGLHLVLLWFGSFKNGLSTYTPAWVKKNAKRFPRAILRKGGGRFEVADTLSIFHPEAQNADTKAFRRLMRHLKEVDESASTVIMVQVENEVGILGDSRDGGLAANQRFTSPVPDDLLSALTKNWDALHETLKTSLLHFQSHSAERNTSWESVFGTSQQTDELFMAYHYAQHVEHVASAGKVEYALPMFTNVWQNYAASDGENSFPNVVGGGGAPGDYPSGGAVINVLDIWQLFAPSLDFIAPDLYLNDYASKCAKYRHRNQPLFIPEQRRDEYGARRMWVAYGSYQALGASPFGIDTLEVSNNPFKKHYGLLHQASRLVLSAQANPYCSIGFFFDELTNTGKDTSPTIRTRFGAWKLSIERAFVFGKPGPGFGMVIHTAGDRFTLIGEGFQVRFSSTSPNSKFTGITSFVEKEITNPETGEARSLRALNGDETRSGQVAVMPAEEPDYGNFPICVTIPAGTRIAECEVYSLEGFDEHELLYCNVELLFVGRILALVRRWPCF